MGDFFKFSMRNSSLIHKVESQKLAEALDSCFVLFGTLQQCVLTRPGGNRNCNLTVRNQVSNHRATNARSRLEFSTSPINDILRELSSIVLYVILAYRKMVGPKIHHLPLDDKPTVAIYCYKQNKTAVQCSSFRFWLPTLLITDEILI